MAHQPTTSNDAVRIARIRAGDRVAFTELVTNHSTSLLTLAITILGDQQEAEDVVQDIFLRIWANRATWAPAGSLGAYLATAVRRRAIDLLRHRRVVQQNTPNIAVDAEQPAGDNTADIRDDALWESVQVLDPRWREALVLRYVQKLSYAEVGQVLHVSPDAARMVVGRAVQALRKILTR